MVKNILCPIDRSPSSLQAFDYAIALARWWGARLTLLEVADARDRQAHSRTSATTPRSATATRTALEADLNRVLTARRVSDVSVEIVLRDGRIVEEILAQARVGRADLVVMGSHGAGGEERKIGSVAEQVLRLAGCPVLTVRRGVKQEPPTGPPFATILCPTDFSVPAQTAMACAQRLAMQVGATLIAMSVIEPSFSRSAGSESSVAEVGDIVESERKNRLNRLATDTKGLRVEPLVAIGTAATEIVAHGQKRAIDLVVMGVSGRGTSEAFVLGSTTHHVIRQGGWPVLSVSSPTGI